jgi:hypothetical protein
LFQQSRAVPPHVKRMGQRRASEYRADKSVDRRRGEAPIADFPVCRRSLMDRRKPDPENRTKNTF